MSVYCRAGVEHFHHPAVPSAGLTTCDKWITLIQKQDNVNGFCTVLLKLADASCYGNDIYGPIIAQNPPLSVTEEPGNECYCHCVIFNECVLKVENAKRQPRPAEERA